MLSHVSIGMPRRIAGKANFDNCKARLLTHTDEPTILAHTTIEIASVSFLIGHSFKSLLGRRFVHLACPLKPYRLIHIPGHTHSSIRSPRIVAMHQQKRARMEAKCLKAQKKTKQNNGFKSTSTPHQLSISMSSTMQQHSIIISFFADRRRCCR